MEPRRVATGLLLLGPLVLVACGGDDPQPTVARDEAPSDASGAEESTGGVAAPGSGFGLGSSAGDGDSAGSGGGGGTRAAAPPSDDRDRSGGSEATSTTTVASSGGTDDLPEPPSTPIETPAEEKGAADFFKDADQLDRDAANPKYAEFRELCGRNTDLLVRLARARKAMRDGGPREEEAYLAVDGQYAEFTEQMGNYMAQRRWNDRDREVMGLLLTRSNEEALNRVRTGS